MKTKPLPTKSLEERTFFNTLDAIIQPKIENYQDAIEIVGHKGKGKSLEGDVIRVKKRAGKRLKKGFVEAIPKAQDSTTKVFSYHPIDTIESVRSGVSHKDFKTIYNLLNLSNKKWAEILGVVEKTIQTIIKNESSLKRKTAEKFLSFLLLVKYGIEVFGSQESFEEWLVYKTYNLKNKAPIDYLDTVQGINMLKEQIFKIETGNLI